MCGIVGIIGNGINATDLKIYKQMLIADTFRGRHSTGQFTIGSSQPFLYYKRAVPGWDFLEYKTADRMINVSQRAIIGHNRYATTGAVNNVNAHPFATDRIVGVHNGSLWDTSSLKDDTMYEVDSEALLNDICANGIDHTASVADGAFALVWYDSRDRTLRMVRNDQRTLAMYLHPNRDVVYIASEKDMLRWIVSRNDTAEFDEEMLMDLDPGELWEFDLSYASKLTEYAGSRNITAKSTYKPVTQTYSYGYGGGSYGSGTTKTKPGKGTIPPKKSVTVTHSSVKKGRGFAELCAEYKIEDKQQIIADFTHISMNGANNTRSYNLGGKIIWPKSMEGLTVNCYGVGEEVGGAGIFQAGMMSMYESETGEIRAVLNKKDLQYLGDSKEVLNFSKKSQPAQA